MQDSKTKKGIGAVDFFCLGFGAIVGVGWAVSVNGWMADSGGPVPAALGYLVTLILMVPIALCYCELVPMYPVAGGGMAFAYQAFNEKIAFVSGWAAVGGFIGVIPWEAIQVTDVLSYLIPGILEGEPLYTVAGTGIYLPTILIGVVCSFLLFALNMRGVESSAMVQKVLCFVLVGAGILGAIASLVGGSAENLRPIYDVSNPAVYGPGLTEVTHNTIFGGMLSILSAAPFFLCGFETIPQSVEEAGGSTTSVGKMVVLSVALACVFYAVLLLCFGAGWPWQEFAHMTNPAAATMLAELYPGAAGQIFYWVIVLGAMAGLFTTWNGFFLATPNLMMGMGRGRLIPAVFAKQNKNKVAPAGLVFCLVLSLIGPFLGAGLIGSLTSFNSLGVMLSWVITAWCLVRLRKTRPDAPRPYRIPGGIWTGIFAGVVSAVVFVLLFIPNGPAFVGKVTVLMFVGWMVIGLVLYLASAPQRRAMSPEEREKQMFAHASQQGE